MVMGLLHPNFQFIRDLSTWREKSEDRATASPRDSFSSLHPDYTAQDVGNILDSGSRELDAGFPGLFSLRDGV